MSLSFNKLPNGEWKTYLQVFYKKGTKYRLYIKPGITEYYDANVRLYYNQKLEKDSFLNHFDSEVLWSKRYSSKEVALEAENILLEYFGKKVNLGFWTSGASEVRKYDHNLWLGINDILYSKQCIG
jgi:hypothetical protein